MELHIPLNGFKLARSVIVLLALSAALLSLSGAAGLGWVLHGRVISASTCNSISGARIFSQYNDNAYNISAPDGNYTLVLGTGNWTVSLSANGYYSGSYNTTYETNGALQHNFALIPIGGTASNCTSSVANTTVVGTSNATMPYPAVNQTGNKTGGTQQAISKLSAVQPSQNVTKAQQSSASLDGFIWSGIAIVIVIVVLLTYLSTRKPPGKTAKAESEGQDSQVINKEVPAQLSTDDDAAALKKKGNTTRAKGAPEGKHARHPRKQKAEGTG